MADEALGVKQEIDAKSIEFTTTPLDAPTVHIDGMQGILNMGGTVKLTFYEDVLNTKSATPQRRHVVTLAMSELHFREIAGYLKKVIEQDVDGDGAK